MLILVLPVSYYRNNHVDIFSYMVDVVITLFAVVRIFFRRMSVLWLCQWVLCSCLHGKDTRSFWGTFLRDFVYFLDLYCCRIPWLESRVQQESEINDLLLIAQDCHFHLLTLT